MIGGYTVDEFIEVVDLALNLEDVVAFPNLTLEKAREMGDVAEFNDYDISIKGPSTIYDPNRKEDKYELMIMKEGFRK
jgi:hypothetical protein